MNANRGAFPGSGMRLAASLALWAAAALGVLPQSAFADVPYFYVVNSGTRMMAEVLAHRTEDGAPVVLWPHHGGPSEQFSVERLARPGSPEPLQEQWFLLRARHSGKCLKTNGFRTGAAIVQETCSGDASQLWRLRAVVTTAADCPARQQCAFGRRTVLENYFDRGRRCLDAANGQLAGPPEQGANLQAWDCVGRFSAANAANQDWDLVDVREWDAPFIAR
jgi:Ricin-type beta-trefoil lectin domain